MGQLRALHKEAGPPSPLRRAVAAVALTASFAAVVFAVLGPVPLARVPAWAASGSPSPWPQLQGNAAHSGVGPANQAIPPYRQAWRFLAPGKERGLSGPVVAGGLVLAAGRDAVYALNLSDGRPAWQLPRAGGPLAADPAVASAGRRSVLLFTEGGRARVSRLRAFDLSSRKHLWDVRLQDVSSSGVSVDGGTAFVGDRSGTLYAVDVGSGRTRWKFQGDGVIDAPPAAAGGRVFVVTSNRSTSVVELVAVRESTGKAEWTFKPTQPATFGTAAGVADGLVYLGFGDRTVYAIGASSGAKRWSADVDSAFSPIVGTAHSGNEVVVAATYPLSAGAGVYRLDARSGARRWWFQFDSFALLSSPVLAGRYVLLGLGDGRLVAVDGRTGHEAWEQGTGTGTLGGIALAGDLVVASKAGEHGGLLAFRADPSGRLIDVRSGTVLDLATSLRNFVVSFAAVGGGVLVLGRLVMTVRRRRGDESGAVDPARDSS